MFILWLLKQTYNSHPV